MATPPSDCHLVSSFAGAASPDDLILWLAYKEATGLNQFNATPVPSNRK
jgi:hypothetical protein